MIKNVRLFQNSSKLFIYGKMKSLPKLESLLFGSFRSVQRGRLGFDNPVLVFRQIEFLIVFLDILRVLLVFLGLLFRLMFRCLCFQSTLESTGQLACSRLELLDIIHIDEIIPSQFAGFLLTGSLTSVSTFRAVIRLAGRLSGRSFLLSSPL